MGANVIDNTSVGTRRRYVDVGYLERKGILLLKLPTSTQRLRWPTDTVFATFAPI